ncbi:MAG: MOSC domain-containing protein [Synechococcales cyanobacterium RM1_1_8]|nr:MOSC domain-containing protein [Synechococcales cyanobacterium RM1_1_8]
MTQITLSGLYIYPIKSAAGIALGEATVGDRGLQHDRRWMVASPNGKFMTQRQHPTMALIRVGLGEQLQLSAPGMADLALPLEPALEAIALEVEVWGDRCAALSMGSSAQAWLSQFLQTPCQLVYMPDQSRRPTAHGQLGQDKLVSFADAYPLLLISEASLADLNGRLAEPVPMDRFRPNLVVTGCGAFAEDAWQRIRIGDIGFDLPKRCDRCSIPGVDQSSGIQYKEPLLTLAKYRLQGGKIWFGQNLVHHATGKLRLGDSIELSN